MKKFTNLSFLFLIVGSIVYANATKTSKTPSFRDLKHERRLSLKTNKFGERLPTYLQISSAGSIKIENP